MGQLSSEAFFFNAEALPAEKRGTSNDLDVSDKDLAEPQSAESSQNLEKESLLPFLRQPSANQPAATDKENEGVFVGQTRQTLPEENRGTSNDLDVPDRQLEEPKPPTTPQIAERESPLLKQPIRILHLPTGNQLSPGDIKIDFSVTTTSAESSPGTGNQTYFTYFDWGYRENIQLGLSFMLNDDPTQRPVNGRNITQQYQSVGPNVKYRFYEDNNWKLGLAASLEAFQIYSGPGLFNNRTVPTVNDIVLPAIQFPATYTPSPEVQLSFVPGVVFYPDTVNGTEFFGTIFNIGAGISWKPIKQLGLFANTTLPLGPGNNAFGSTRDFSRQLLWTFGANLTVTPSINLQLHGTNSFGGTPATGILPLPSTEGDQFLFGGTFTLVPSNKEKPENIYQTARSQQLLLGGFTITSPYVVTMRKFALNGAIDTGGSYSADIIYSPVNQFQFEVLIAQIEDFDTKTILGASIGDNLQYRFGGKLNFVNQLKGAPVSFSGRVSVGRESGDQQGYWFLEAPLMYEFNPQVAVLFSPKTVVTGGNSLFGLGFGLNYGVTRNLQLIAEVTPLLTGETTVWSAGARYFPFVNFALDLYGTNSTNQLDLGQLAGESGGRLGFAIHWFQR